ALQFVEAWQVAQFLQPEMVEKVGRRAKRYRPAGRTAPATKPDPAGLHQHIDRAPRRADAANILDLRPRHRLVIGDNRQHLQSGTGKLADLVVILADHEGEVRRGAEGPAVAAANQVDTAKGIDIGETPHYRRHIGSLR